MRTSPFPFIEKRKYMSLLGKKSRKRTETQLLAYQSWSPIAARVKAHRTHLPTATERVLESYYRPSRPTITGCKKMTELQNTDY
jgi:hypothetical protein